MKISQNFVAFSEYMNFKTSIYKIMISVGLIWGNTVCIILQLCTALHKKSYLLCCLAIYFFASQFFTVFCPVVLNLCKIMQCTAVSIRPSSIFFCRAELYRLGQTILYNFVRGAKFFKKFIKIPKPSGWSGHIFWRIQIIIPLEFFKNS